MTLYVTSPVVGFCSPCFVNLGSALSTIFAGNSTAVPAFGNLPVSVAVGTLFSAFSGKFAFGTVIIPPAPTVYSCPFKLTLEFSGYASPPGFVTL